MTRILKFFYAKVNVRLNLINHFVGFISCQFACNLTFRKPVFRWDSCKGSMWESVKKNSEVCILQGLVTRSREWLAAGKSPKEAHVWSMYGSWRVTPAVALNQNKLIRSNYVDWKRNLDIVLTAEEHKYVLTLPCPNFPSIDAPLEKNSDMIIDKNLMRWPSAIS